MCFDDHDTYTTRTYIANGSRYSSEYTRPRYGMSWRRRNGFGGSYYPSRYYNRRPSGRYMSTVMMQQNRYSGYGGYGQGRGYPRGVVAGGYSGHNSYPQGVATGGYSGYPQCNSYPRGVVAGGYNRYSSGYGRSYPDNRVAMPGQTAMRSYYNAAPSYGYAAQAYVYPPGPSTTTTTYHVTNSHGARAGDCAHLPAAQACNHGPTREDIQMENRRVATERGAYDPRRIKPADARSDDPFWCRERNGEWHLRTYYQIENECHPGRWQMDAEVGFLVFHRD